MRKFAIGTVVFGVLSTAAMAQQIVKNDDLNPPEDAYQVRYAANLSAGDSLINLTSTGGVVGIEPASDICANVYVLADDQQLIACCACPLTPNHLQTLSVKNDLVSNTLTPGIPTDVTIALIASSGAETCNAATLPGGVTEDPVYLAPLARGLRAWGTTLHAAPGGGFAVTETEFSHASLSDSELTKLTSYCGFIQANGSGYGICTSCHLGAAGAEKQ